MARATKKAAASRSRRQTKSAEETWPKGTFEVGERVSLPRGPALVGSPSGNVRTIRGSLLLTRPGTYTFHDATTGAELGRVTAAAAAAAGGDVDEDQAGA